jgi:subtilisin
VILNRFLNFIPPQIQDAKSATVQSLNPQTIPGEYIVFFKDDLPEMQRLDAETLPTQSAGTRMSREAQNEMRESRKQVIKEMMGRVMTENGLAEREIRNTYDMGQLKGALLQARKEDIQKLKRDSRIALVEQNEVIALELNPGAKDRLIPSDDGPANEMAPYGVNNIGGATDMTGSWNWVFIMDSGIDLDHPDLNVNASHSRSFLPNNGDPNDGFGHGTHVAGIIGAKDNGFGLLGVAAGATLVSYRVLDENGYGTKASLIDAITYLSGSTVPGDIVNISLGTNKSEALDLAIATAKEQYGVHFAISAGNEGMNTSSFSPAAIRLPNVHIVGSVNANNQLSSFSNYGTNVNYLSYGEEVYSTYKDGTYCTLSGTSMAAPHVAGLLLVGGGTLKSTNNVVTLPSGNTGMVAHK